MPARRVLLVTHRFLPRYLAGTELYTASLARALAGRGHAVQIFTGDPEGGARTETWEGLPVTVVPWGWGGRGGPASPAATFLAGFGNPAVEARFRQVCAEFQPGIVHIQHLMGLSPWLPALAHRAGARVVMTLQDFWLTCGNTWLYRWDGQLCPGPRTGYHCGGCALQRLGRAPQPAVMAAAAPLFWARTWVLARARRAVDHFIAPSPLSARVFIQQGGPAERVTVLPDVVLSGPLAAPAPERPPGSPVQCVYIGSLTPPKGVRELVQAFNGLAASAPGARLTVYGDPAADPAYTRALRAASQHPGITLAGPLARADLPAVLAGADLLIQPSLWYETYSIVIDEALSAGVPVMVSSHGAPAERLQPGLNGLTAPPGDVAAWRAQLERFVGDPELRRRLRAGARSRPPPYLDAHLRDIEALYSQL